MSNIAEQFDELYSRWSMMDKSVKLLHLDEMMQRARNLYQVLMLSYGRKGYLTSTEYNQVSQINQFFQDLQVHKMQVNQDLYNEMQQHIAKMISKKGLGNRVI